MSSDPRRDPDLCVITCALTGVLANREPVPRLPLHARRRSARRRSAPTTQGASVVHIHARNDDGTPTFSPATFARIQEEVTKRSPILLNFSTGTIFDDVSEQMHLHPREPTGDRRPQHGDDELLEVLREAEGLRLRHGLSEHVRQDREAALGDERGGREARARVLRHRAHARSLAAPRHGGAPAVRSQFSFIVNVLGGIPPTVESLQLQKKIALDLAPDSEWEVIGISHCQWRMLATALVLGGNVRVGLEDNLYLPNGTMAKSNGELVEVAARMVRDVGRKVASVEQARQILALKARA